MTPYALRERCLLAVRMETTCVALEYLRARSAQHAAHVVLRAAAVCLVRCGGWSASGECGEDVAVPPGPRSAHTAVRERNRSAPTKHVRRSCVGSYVQRVHALQQAGSVVAWKRSRVWFVPSSGAHADKDQGEAMAGCEIA